MPINPIRFNPIDAPPPPRPMPAVDFSGISSLGDSIGHYREQQEVGRLLAGAVDPKTGGLDLNKAASALAITGRDPIKYLNAFTGMQSEKRAEAAQQALQQHYRAIESEAVLNRQLRQQEIEQGKTSEFQIENPLGVGEPKRYRYSPGSGVQQIYPAPAPAATTGPRSEVPALAPAPVAFNPEEAPPYRVAGPMMPPPQPEPLATPAQAGGPAQAAPAPAATAREAALQEFARANGPDATAIFRDVLDYKRGLPGDDKLKQRWITAARAIDPTFDPTRFEEAKKPLTESQAKMQLYGNRALRAEQVLRMPDVQDAGMTFSQRALGNVPFVGNYMVNPSYQRFEQAARDMINAFLRPESGAVIGASEFANAYAQYIPRPNDSPQVLADKQAAREREIAGIITAAGQNYVPSHLFENGKIVRNPKAPATEEPAPTKTIKPVASEAEANALISQARAALKRDPNSRDVILQRLRERNIRNPEQMLGQ